MLILRRKAGESIVIGDEIKVTVIDIKEGSIRLAVEAPKRITVLRSELLQAADANRDAARQTNAEAQQALLSLLPKGTGQATRSIFRKERKAPTKEEQAKEEQTGEKPSAPPKGEGQ